MTKEKDFEEWVATGRRKTAVASVRLRPGSGKVDINHREFDHYFPGELQRKLILAPLNQIKKTDAYDMIIRVKGGGVEAQAEAVRLGLARALVLQNENLKQELKPQGFLRRDSRKKERKKYGLAGARKRFQYSKR